MKTEAKIKLIVIGYYLIIYLIICGVLFYSFHFSLVLTLLIGIALVAIYPLICILEAWIGSTLEKRKNSPPKDK